MIVCGSNSSLGHGCISTNLQRVSLVQENLRVDGSHGCGPVAHRHHLPHRGLWGRVAQHLLREGSVSLHRSHGELAGGCGCVGAGVLIIMVTFSFGSCDEHMTCCDRDLEPVSVTLTAGEAEIKNRWMDVDTKWNRDRTALDYCNSNNQCIGLLYIQLVNFSSVVFI